MAEPLPAKVPLKLYRGDTRIWEDVFTTVAGAPIDLTGYVFLAQIRADTEIGSSVMATMDVDIVDPAAGRIRRTLTAAEANKLVVGSATWDLQGTAPDGVVRTYMTGRVRILGDVSR